MSLARGVHVVTGAAGGIGLVGRMGTAAEVADCIVFLLSERSSHVTGQTLNVNGGAFMQ